MVMQAQETFVADLADGSTVRVIKGEVLPDGHELVKRDADGSGTLFRRLDMGEPEVPPKRPRGRPRKSTVAALPRDNGADDENGG